MKIKLVLKKRDVVPDPNEGKRTSFEMDEMNQRLDSMDAIDVRILWATVFEGATLEHAKAPIWLLKLGLEYWALLKGYKRNKKDPGEKVKKRYQLCKSLNQAALEKESFFLGSQTVKEEVKKEQERKKILIKRVIIKKKVVLRRKCAV